jgi:hypothetical protein
LLFKKRGRKRSKGYLAKVSKGPLTSAAAKVTIPKKPRVRKGIEESGSELFLGNLWHRILVLETDIATRYVEQAGPRLPLASEIGRQIISPLLDRPASAQRKRATPSGTRYDKGL